METHEDPPCCPLLFCPCVRGRRTGVGVGVAALPLSAPTAAPSPPGSLLLEWSAAPDTRGRALPASPCAPPAACLSSPQEQPRTTQHPLPARSKTHRTSTACTDVFVYPAAPPGAPPRSPLPLTPVPDTQVKGGGGGLFERRGARYWPTYHQSP